MRVDFDPMAVAPRPDVSMPELEGVSHHFVEARGIKFHVAEAGTGSPVVLLHGWPQHWWCWRGVIPRLAEHHRVLAIDLRGHGWSETPDADYAKQTLADDVVAILDELGIGEFDLIGHDWGGWTGFILALQNQDRVKHYVALNIVSPWPDKPSFGALASIWRIFYQVVLSVPAAAKHVVVKSNWVNRAIVSGSVNRDAWSRDDLESFAATLRSPERARSTSALYRAFLLKELAAFIKGGANGQRLSVPTLLIHGTKDPVIRAERLGRWTKWADDMAVELRDDSAHFIADELPEVVADRALKLFAGASPAEIAAAGDASLTGTAAA